MKNIILKIFGGYELSSDKGGNGIDWILLLATLPLLGAGLVTMNSFVGDGSYFNKQLTWICISLIVFFVLSNIDFRFLRKTWVSVVLFAGSCSSLVLLFFVAKVTKGAISWFNLGLLSFQPSDPIKLVVIIILAKYFSRRHIEIANMRHIFVSGVYAFCISPYSARFRFGNNYIFYLARHDSCIRSVEEAFTSDGGCGHFCICRSLELWLQRISKVINPLADIHGTGYNAYQSTIAVGAGKMWGKGVGYGTQSRLKLLREYQTDFVFAAFAEEWGFAGVMIVFFLFGVVVWRIIKISMKGDTNFEILFGAGVATLIIVHFTINK